MIFLLKAYRYMISPFLGSHCRFYPSCSQYSEQAFKEYGVLQAMKLTVFRLLKCHPWHQGGYDPLPSPINFDKD